METDPEPEAPMPQLYQLHVTLNPRQEPRDSHAMHRAIEAVAHGPRTLWARPRRGHLILRTPLPAAPWERIPGTRTITTGPARTHWPTGTPVTWALIGNPAWQPSVPRDPATGKRPRSRPRLALDPGSVPDWATRKLAGAIAAEGVTAEALPPATGRGITLARYALAGTGTVTDPGALAHLLAAGVGRGKGLGCGLLLVREADR